MPLISSTVMAGSQPIATSSPWAGTTSQSGLGKLAFGNMYTGSQGFLGSGGQFGLGQTMMTAGMGLGLMQAFGKDVTGSAITQKVPMSKEGKKLQKTLETATRKKLSGENLATPYVRQYVSIQKGRLKRRAGRHVDIAGKVSGRRVRTGRSLGGAIAAAGARTEGLAAPDIWEAGFIQDEFRKGMSGLENIRNIELQTPLLKAGGAYTKMGLGQLRGARQGAALGDFAQWLALQKYPYYPTF